MFLEDLLNAGHTNATAEEFQLVDIIKGKTGFSNNCINRVKNTLEERSRCLFEVFSFDSCGERYIIGKFS